MSSAAAPGHDDASAVNFAPVGINRRNHSRGVTVKRRIHRMTTRRRRRPA